MISDYRRARILTTNVPNLITIKYFIVFLLNNIEHLQYSGIYKFTRFFKEGNKHKSALSVFKLVLS